MSFYNDQTFFYCDPRYNGVEESIDDRNGINFYPNPARDQLIFNIPEVYSQLNLQLLNYQGDKLLQQVLKPGNNLIQIDHFPPGAYLMILNNEKVRQYVKKLIVVN